MFILEEQKRGEERRGEVERRRGETERECGINRIGDRKENVNKGDEIKERKENPLLT